jgi:hypothetical protein
MHFPRDFTSPTAVELERNARIRHAYGIVPDGQRVAVPLMLMDGKSNNNNSNDDPCAAAYAERNAWYRDAWKQPSSTTASPHPNLANRGIPEDDNGDDDEQNDDDGDRTGGADHGDNVAARSAARADRAAQARREDANARYVAHLVNAWKET